MFGSAVCRPMRRSLRGVTCACWPARTSASVRLYRRVSAHSRNPLAQLIRGRVPTGGFNGEWYLYVVNGIWPASGSPIRQRPHGGHLRPARPGSDHPDLRGGAVEGPARRRVRRRRQARTYSLGRSSAAPAKPWAIVNGQPSLYVTAGGWRGYWLPESSGSPRAMSRARALRARRDADGGAPGIRVVSAPGHGSARSGPANGGRLWPSPRQPRPPGPARVAEPGTPYGAEDVLSAMRDSRRPGGVPDQLETPDIASAIAEQLWTWDGQPWASMSVAGSLRCATSCSVDVSGGSPTGRRWGRPLLVRRRSGRADPAELIDASLQGLPDSLDPRLDAIARDGTEAGALEGLELLAADWLPPPDTGRGVPACLPIGRRGGLSPA